jgi:hypothetical protein
MQLAFRVALFGCLLPAPMLLAQHNSDLKGNFPFNETIHIVQQPASGGKCGVSLSGPVSTALYNDTGYWFFDGKGNMSAQDHGVFVTVFPPTDASQVTGAAASCKGTYTIPEAGKVYLHYKCSLDNWISYFDVHSLGHLTGTTLLVETMSNSDGSPGVTPYVYNGATVGCSTVLENTTVSLTK